MSKSIRVWIIIPLMFFCMVMSSQTSFEADDAYHFGRANPEAPEQINDFEKLIGLCEWTDKSESVVYPTWKIACKKRM